MRKMVVEGGSDSNPGGRKINGWKKKAEKPSELCDCSVMDGRCQTGANCVK